ncbi:type IX secretion system protein PorD [Peijinzhouia sedimentorum]|tara:strand:- start:119 stop:1015 length:897 start_codon:yes stop_codon:yes gene_type:complete
MSKKSLLFLVLSFLSYPILAQEINCNVTVNAQNIQISDRSIFQDMENAFEQFLNNRRWTSETFRPEERIRCNIVLTLETMPNIGSFTASMQIQVLRPVYGTNYETVVFNFADRNWQFDYTESLPLEFNENTFNTNLTSMLGFYAYVILGYDYDSFSRLGGSAFFDKAFNVVINAQQSPRAGWKQFESNRNRYWITENLMSSQMVPVREAIYEYHRLGLDMFGRDPEQGRDAIIASLQKIKEVNKLRPNSVIVNSFFDAKSDELANIFSQGNEAKRQEVLELLRELDPTNTEKYSRINP